ncbi:DUF3472 domain-containing protein [Chitinophaga skermanii]|nr:DUF3472 domain-containing protein [Chitinophaga skermanii]
MKKLGTALLLCIYALTTSAQSVTLPGFTAYASPLEEGIVIDEHRGVENWESSQAEVKFYCYISNPGKLNISLDAKSTGASLKVITNGVSKQVKLSSLNDYTKLPVLQTEIKKAGFYDITITGLTKTGKTFADIRGVILEGTATKDIQYNPKPWRRSASVHLKYTPPANEKVEWFYGEIKVPTGEDKIGTYYMSCGFHRGYFGIQVNSATERRVIFSVWDAGGEPETRDKVRYEDQVTLLAKGDEVVAHGFGGEGTGGHSHWVYNWQADSTYRFLMHSVPEDTYTTYTAYFYVPEHKEWKLVASFRAPKDGQYMKNLYSFLENFSFENGNISCKAYYGNHWIKTAEGKWYPLNQAKFSNDATARAKDRLDYGGGAEQQWFYLWTAGFKPANAKAGDTFEHTSNVNSPVINLPKF